MGTDIPTGTITDIPMITGITTGIKSRARLFIRGMKGGDFVVLVLALGALIFSTLRVYSGSAVSAAVTIQAGGERWVFPLEGETIFTAPGPLGDTVVELKGKSARILSSPCANQTCIAQGSIRRHGQWLACLPNRVMVSVSGEGGEGFDSITW
jgi:hypothetical protein